MRKLILLVCIFFLPAYYCVEPTHSKEQQKSNFIRRVKLLQDSKSSKIKIDLTSSIDALPVYKATDSTISFELNAVIPHKKSEFKEDEYLISEKGFVSTVKLHVKPNSTKFEIHRQYFTPVKSKLHKFPPSLVVELPRSYFFKETSSIKPGINKHLIHTVGKRGPIVIHVVEINLNNKKISFKVGMPNNKSIQSKETLSNLVKEQMAFVGVNANYFDVNKGNPLGTLITNGTWLVGPIYNRVAVGFSKHNKVSIDQVKLIGEATAYEDSVTKKIPKAMFTINGLNTPAYLYDKVGLYTQNWGSELDLGKNQIALLVQNDQVKKIATKKVKIPTDSYVLVGGKSTPLMSIQKNDMIDIQWDSSPDWSDIQESISGGPYLIMSGKVYIDEKEQRFKFSTKDTYAPRSAIGIDSRDKLYLITVDGRKSNYSVGVSLEEFAHLLTKLHLKEAINLDGGGSTTLVADGKIINTLSERHERKISNGLLVFYED